MIPEEQLLLIVLNVQFQENFLMNLLRFRILWRVEEFSLKNSSLYQIALVVCSLLLLMDSKILHFFALISSEEFRSCCFLFEIISVSSLHSCSTSESNFS